jgi:hypothetical protein
VADYGLYFKRAVLLHVFAAEVCAEVADGFVLDEVRNLGARRLVERFPRTRRTSHRRTKPTR